MDGYGYSIDTLYCSLLKGMKSTGRFHRQNDIESIKSLLKHHLNSLQLGFYHPQKKDYPIASENGLSQKER